jgi:hypothetical protein
VKVSESPRTSITDARGAAAGPAAIAPTSARTTLMPFPCLLGTAAAAGPFFVSRTRNNARTIARRALPGAGDPTLARPRCD